MNIEVRVYKRYDTDILALHDAGYSITKMMTDAVTAYANGRPCHFFIDEMVPFDLNDKKNVRLRLKINNNDYNTIRLLKDIKHGYRSNFCKQVLRNAMIQQNLVCYFSSLSFLPLQEANANNLNMQAYPNLIMCSQYRRLTQKINIMGNDITITHEKGYAYNSAGNSNNQQPSEGYTVPQPQIPSQPQEMSVYAKAQSPSTPPQPRPHIQGSNAANPTAQGYPPQVPQPQMQSRQMPPYGNGATSMPGYPNAPYGQNVNPQMQNMGQGIPAQGVPHQQMPELQPNSYTKNPYEAMAQPAMQPQPQQYAALPEQSPAPQHNEPGPAVPEADIQPITVQRAETEETVEKNTGFDDSESDDSEALMAIFENL